MPYPNEHACRLAEPIKDATFARKNGEREHDGKKYDVIYQRKDGAMQQQAFRYPKDTWPAEAARSHCTSHKGSFESAKDTAVRMFKTNDEKQIVYGVIFEPEFNDADDEYVEKDDIEEAANDYLLNIQKTLQKCLEELNKENSLNSSFLKNLKETPPTWLKLSHRTGITNKALIAQSYTALSDFEVSGELVKEGSWIVAMKIYDKELWKETKESITGLSAGGTAEIF